MEKKMKQNKGITLIALVVTIIVLLILSAVTINLVLGQNGIIGKAQSAQSKTAEAEARDQAQLEWLDLQVETKGESVSAYAGKLNDEDKQSRDIKEVGSGYVVITKNGYDFKIYDNGTIEMLRKIDAKYIPTVTSKITTDAEGTQEVVENVESGTPLYIVLTINLQKGTVSSVTSAENIESVGTYVYKVTKNGTYTFTITTNERTDNKYTTTHTIEVSKFKIANMPENWTDASYEKTSWGYEYKDVETNKEVNANAPVLTSEMTPIKYVAGSTTGLEEGSKWANAMTPDGSMWVWIPRYAYKIEYTDSSDISKGGKIDVVFLKEDTDKYEIDGVEYTAKRATDTDIRDSDYIVHPCFTTTVDSNGTKSYENGEWEKELKGIWIAKYEASSINNTIQIKPNINSLNSRNIDAMYTLAKNATYGTTDSNLNSHMIKNSEWGATVYLAYSKYGVNGSSVSINNTKITGKSAGRPGDSTTTSSESYEYNTSQGILASTTGNVYGIYDMAGGVYEFVAAYYYKSSYLNYGQSFTGVNSSTQTESPNVSTSTATKYKTSREKLGDGIKETRGWSKINNFPNSTYGFFVRGGEWKSGSGAEILCFGTDIGGGNDSMGFRTCIAI